MAHPVHRVAQQRVYLSQRAVGQLPRVEPRRAPPGASSGPYPGRNQSHTTPALDNTEPDTDLLVLLEDVLLHIDELHQQRADTTEIKTLLAYATGLRAKLS